MTLNYRLLPDMMSESNRAKRRLPLEGRYQMMKKLRIGVAGLGRIGWDFHCRKLADHRDFKLVAVTDTEEDRCAEAVRTFQCRAFADYNTMLAEAGLDVVVIATPTHLHRSMAVSAFKAGVHVLLEKPMAATLADARAIVRCARAHDRIMTVYQPHRLAPYYRHLLKLIADGRIGRVYQVRCGCFGYARRNDWQSRQRFGGGMLNNYGAHFIDQMLDLTGGRVRRLLCVLRRVATLGDADDAVKLIFESANGILVDLEINIGTALAPFPFRIEVNGPTGVIRMQPETFQVRWFDPRDMTHKSLEKGLAGRDRKYPSDEVPWREESGKVDSELGIDVFADLARSVRTGRQPFVTPDQTIRVMEMTDRCRRDSRGIRESRPRGQ